MSHTISHPFRVDGAGTVVTVAQNSAPAAAQCAGHVLACTQGARPLSGPYGLPDPVAGIDTAMVRATLALCEPELDVDNVTVRVGEDGRATVEVTARWGVGTVE